MRHHVDPNHGRVRFLACATQQHRQHRVPFRVVVASGVRRDVILNSVMRATATKNEARYRYKGAGKGDFHGCLRLKIVHQPLRFSRVLVRLEKAGIRVHVLVAPARNVEDDQVVFG